MLCSFDLDCEHFERKVFPSLSLSFSRPISPYTSVDSVCSVLSLCVGLQTKKEFDVLEVYHIFPTVGKYNLHVLIQYCFDVVIGLQIARYMDLAAATICNRTRRYEALKVTRTTHMLNPFTTLQT